MMFILLKLKIGNNISGYKNTNLNELTIGNLTYLEYLDVQNCPNLTSSLDLTQYSSLSNP